MPIAPIPVFDLGFATRHGAITAVPVFARTATPRVDYLVATTALAAGTFEIHESPVRAQVGMLEARNRGRRRVLILEGDHVLGAKQNRMLTSSALIGPATCVDLPASCVEQGRWKGPTEQFAGLSTMAPASLRRIAKLSVTEQVLGDGHRAADQQRIWSTIADQQRRLAVTSATTALSHTFASRAPELARVSAALPYPAQAIGLAIGVGAELMSIDVFDRPETCAHYWERLLHGATLDSLAARQDATLPDIVAQVEAMLARDFAWRPVAPVGDGEEARAALPDAAASLLQLDGRLVHFGVVTGVRPLSSTRKPRMRRELPAELAQRYQIVDRIGVGGTKEVFRATVLAGGPDVAIARMPFVDEIQFDGEIVALRRVEGDYVPRVVESLLDDDGDGYLVMERCEGPNLAAVAGTGALPLADAAPILLHFARGVRSIHAAHVLHRDIKLENAMLSTAGGDVRLKIVDFGLSARAASDTTAVGMLHIGGTLPYMAREVLRGHRLDARSDVYAFGVCCFRLLAGDFPAPPYDHESEWNYMNRLRQLEVHDLTPLPALPPSVRTMIGRMLELDPTERPLMPEVVAGFEAAFGELPLHLPRPAHARVPRRPRPVLERAMVIETAVEAPEHVIVTPCMQAPIVVLSPRGDHTAVGGYRQDGLLRWGHEVPGRLTAGLRADLDGDGMRELYLAGAERFAVLGASGRRKLACAIPAYAQDPTLLAIRDAERRRIAVDGRLLDPQTGEDRGLVPFAYQGNGRELIATDDRRGLVYNGFATQAFRGAFGSAPAVIYHPGDTSFLVAHLEVARVATPRVQLAVYGPGGACRHTLPIADGQLPTGDTSEIERVLGRATPLFSPACSPLAVLGPDRTAVVIVPLLEADRTLPPCLVAYELPSGRRLWKTELTTRGGRAILGDLDGDGCVELIVGDGGSITAYDPWSGAASEPIACGGVPVAFGDPFASGHAHLIVASRSGIESWRGTGATPGALQWSGVRGDTWRTGTLRADGQPLGPV